MRCGLSRRPTGGKLPSYEQVESGHGRKERRKANVIAVPPMPQLFPTSPPSPASNASRPSMAGRLAACTMPSFPNAFPPSAPEALIQLDAGRLAFKRHQAVVAIATASAG